MALELKNCNECGRVFADNGKTICNKCLDKEDAKYTIVRKFVSENPGASILEVSEGTGVEEEIVLHLVKEGRLKVEGHVEARSCVRCGKRISKGTYCEGCFNVINSELNSVIGPKEDNSQKAARSKQSDKMYVRPKK